MKKLNSSQIKFINNNLNKLSAKEIANKLDLPVPGIESYLKKLVVGAKLNISSQSLKNSNLKLHTLELFFDRFGYYFLAFFILLYIFLISLLCLTKYHSFSYDDFDLAIQNQTLWNTWHGKPFWTTIHFPAGYYFRYHFPAIYILIAPLYKLFLEGPPALLILQTIGLAIGAMPLYLIVRSALNSSFAVLFSILYLASPALGFMNQFDFHNEAFIPVCLLWAFFFYQKEHFKSFICSLLFVAFCREDQFLAVLAFGLMAYFQKRPKKWITWPLVLGCIWAILVIKIIIPFFNDWQPSIYERYYDHLAPSTIGKILRIIFDPFYVLGYCLSVHKPQYLHHIFGPVGYLALLSPIHLIIMAPSLFQNLLTNYGPASTILYQYTGTIIPTTFVAAGYGIKRLLQWTRIKKIRPYLLTVLGILALFSTIVIGPHMKYGTFLKDYRITVFDQIKDKFIQQIPSNSHVTTTFDLLPKLSSRPKVATFHYLMMGREKTTLAPYTLPEDVDQALINFADQLTFYGFYDISMSPNIRNFLDNNNWSVKNAYRTLIHFEKNAQKPKKLFTPYSQIPAQALPMNLTINSQVLWKAYKVKTKNVFGKSVLKVECFWEALNKPTTDYHLAIWFKQHDTEIDRMLLSIPYFIHPTSLWEKGEKYKTVYWLAPEDQEYSKDLQIEFTLFDARTGRGIPIVPGEGSPSVKDGRFQLKTS